MRKSTTHLLTSTLLLALTFGVQSAIAQRGLQIGGQLLLGSPQGEFRDKVDNFGFGGSAFFGYQVEGAPVVMGLELGGMIYGHESRVVPLSTTIPDIFVDVETNNMFVTGHTVLRLQPNRGFIRPYIDGLFGFNYLFTETSVHDEDFNDDYGSVFSSTHEDDIGLSYGAGIGAMIKLASTNSEEGLPLGIFLDLRTRFLNGSKVNYLREGSIRREETGLEYDTQRSKTDTAYFQVGIIFQF